MSDKTTLADLRIAQHKGWYEDTWTEYRKATAQDLIEAVESIGGEIRYITKLGDGQVSENGRYLILRIEDE